MCRFLTSLFWWHIWVFGDIGWMFGHTVLSSQQYFYGVLNAFFQNKALRNIPSLRHRIFGHYFWILRPKIKPSRDNGVSFTSFWWLKQQYCRPLPTVKNCHPHFCRQHVSLTSFISFIWLSIDLSLILHNFIKPYNQHIISILAR